MSNDADTKTQKRAPRLGDVLCWFALKAAAAKLCERLSRSGERDRLEIGRAYPINLHLTGSANGTAIDERITGRLARDEDKRVSNAPAGQELLAEALACLSEPERSKMAERIKLGRVQATEATRALAAQVIAARKVERIRAGDVRLVPAG